MTPKRRTVLTDEDINDADKEILDELREGRVTPALIAERRDLSRSYVSQRLIRLREHGHIDELVRGLYELVNDPQKSKKDDC